MSLDDFERRLATALEWALAAGLLSVLLVILVLVAMRYMFEAGLVGANELATVAFVYLSSVGSAVVLAQQEHIRVDLLPRRLKRSAKLALEIAILGLVGILNAVLLAYSVPWIEATGLVPMPATQIPRLFAQVSLPLGCGLACIFCGTRIAALLGAETAR